MNIILYRTTKRENSTATPDSKPAWFSQRLELSNVTLKDETSVLNPVFICRLPTNGHDGQNYLWAFGRYYWITDVVILHNHLFELQCRIDPLGSYRGHIRNTQAYVLYDSTPNTEIPDRRLGVKTTATYSQNTALMPWGFEQANGTRFIAITGNRKNEAGADATGVYSVTQAGIEDLGYEFSDDIGDLWRQAEDDSGLSGSPDSPAYRMGFYSGILAGLYDPNYGGSWPSSTNDIAMITYCLFQIILAGVQTILLFPLAVVIFLSKWLYALFVGGKALENVKAAYWLPFTIDDGDPVSEIALGDWVEAIEGGAKKIQQPIKAQNVEISIPWQYSDWRNVSNTEIQLFIPLIGVINIPSSAVKGHSTITVMCSLNLFSGTFTVKIRCGQAVLGTYGANCSSPILIGNSNVNMGQVVNTISSAAAVAAGVVTGGAGLAVGGAVSAIASGFESLVPINTSVGGIGGGTGNALGSSIWCTTICHNTSDAPSDLLPIIGTPTNVLKLLNGSGYCQTMQAHMDMNAVVGESYPTQGEVDAVNAALDGGVFLE